MSTRIKAALHDFLQTVAPLTALVGNRIFPNESRQSTPLPKVVFTRESGEDKGHLGGRLRYRVDTIQVECWGRTANEADMVADAVRGGPGGEALDFFVGTWGNLIIQKAKVIDDPDFIEPPRDGTDMGRHCVPLAVKVVYNY